MNCDEASQNMPVLDMTRRHLHLKRLKLPAQLHCISGVGVLTDL